MKEAVQESSSDTLDRLLARHVGGRGALLPLLHDLQHHFGFVADDLVPAIAEALNLSRAEVHGVLTFYSDFRRKAAGRHVIKLCRAEACQARGGAAIEQALEDRLGIRVGQTRMDQSVTLEPVYCLGLCAIGPNLMVDDRPIARVDAARVSAIVEAIGG